MDRDEQILAELKLQLKANFPVPVNADRIQRDARKGGYDFTVSEIEKGLALLLSDELIELKSPKGSTRDAYALTAEGFRICKKEGF